MKRRRCWKVKATLLTDEAVRRNRVWTYGVLVLRLQREPVRRKKVWHKKWRPKK